jgi:hypothetical protein
MYLMLKQADDPAHVLCYRTVSKGLWNVYFWVSDAAALHAEFVRNGAKIDDPVCDQPYRRREFGAQDIDGCDIGFGQDIAA